MAQAGTVAMSVALGSASQTASSLSDDEVRTIREYERIVQFRDSILSGKHPRIKVPAQSSGASQSSPRTFSMNASEAVVGRNGAVVGGYQADSAQPLNASSQRSAAAMPSTGSSAAGPSNARAFGSMATQIDPLLLTKSDELIKAEFQLRRQRIERTLKDELDQRRAANKTASEQAPDIDLSDILAKALTLVQATAPSLPADANMAANASDSSDSFDENTFYSSQHDTPEPHISPPAHNTPADLQHLDASASTVTRHDTHDTPAAFEAQPNAVTAISNPRNPPGARFLPHETGRKDGGNLGPSTSLDAPYRLPYQGEQLLAGKRPTRDDGDVQFISSNGSGATSRSDNSGNTDSEQHADRSRAQASSNLLQSYRSEIREPVIRAHDLLPFAPQPAHVSPLATARHHPVVDPEIGIMRGAPAQVAALRQDPMNGTSPESSPQGEKGSKKKNKKNKKRKAAEARGAERLLSPDIKPEPRSPSPLVAPQFTRPNKRQRQSHRTQQDLDYDEPRLGLPVEIIRHEEYDPRAIRDDRMPVAYERAHDPYPRPSQPSAAPSIHRFEHPIYDERRPEEQVQYVHGGPSPSHYGVHHGAGEVRAMRSATYSTADPVYRDEQVYHPDGRMSVRPVIDRPRSRSPLLTDRRQLAMGPPQAPPPRIVRDQFGREYYEPPPPGPVARHSVAPGGRGPEHEVIYERAPVRAASRLPGSDLFEQNGIIYRRASPTLPPRRVVTQPEYGAVDYPSYRQREYSGQTMTGPPVGQDFGHYRGAPDRRPEEISREYITRSASVRPAEQVRYEYGRVQSVRPDLPVREYAASVHPESRREMAPQVIREFAGRPTESRLSQREYSARPVERYYDRPVIQDDEVSFIERPRTVQQEIVYDDGRREVYR